MSDKPVKILLIEDNPGDVRLVREMLAEMPDVSYTFESAGRLSAGLEYLSKKKFDVVLLDLGLPDSQGLDTISRVHAKAAETPIVVLTGLADETIGVEAMRHGAEDYLAKGQIHSRALWRVMNYAAGRKQMEKTLWESKERLKEAQALGRIGNWEFDLGTQKVHWSDEVYELYERDKSLGPPSAEEEAIYYAPEEAERLREFARIAMKTGQRLEYELTANLPSGKTAFFNATMCPFKDNDNEGRIINLFGTVQDITERKQAMDTLQKSEMRLRQLIEKNADGIIIIDQDGIMCFVNPAAEGLFQREAKQLAGSPFGFTATADETSTIEVVIAGGNLRAVEMRTVDIEWEGTPAIMASLRDVTEQKRVEKELIVTNERLQASMKGAISAIAAAAETRDPYTAGHQRRVATLSGAIAAEMGLEGEQIEAINAAGTLHDIGKMYVPSEILSKPGRLTALEFNLIKAHPEISRDILKTLELPWTICPSVLQHHERMDGSGYPSGLSGEAIVLEARILAVADVVEAMASHRPYRPALGIEKALEEISKNRDILYDPDVVDACLRLFNEKGFKFEE